DYAAIVGGCVGASTPAGARMAGLSPTGTMPHSLVLIFGDTVRAAEAFDRDLEPDVPRIVLIDTFKDEAEEALRVASALGDRLYGVRLDTPAERGRVTADLVHVVRARLDQAGATGRTPSRHVPNGSVGRQPAASVQRFTHALIQRARSRRPARRPRGWRGRRRARVRLLPVPAGARAARQAQPRTGRDRSRAG